MGGWGDGQKKQMRDEQQDRAEAATSESENGNGSAGSSKGAADAAPAEERGVDEGQDVYVSGGRETAGDLFALVPVVLQIGVKHLQHQVAAVVERPGNVTMAQRVKQLLGLPFGDMDMNGLTYSAYVLTALLSSVMQGCGGYQNLCQAKSGPGIQTC